MAKPPNSKGKLTWLLAAGNYSDCVGPRRGITHRVKRQISKKRRKFLDKQMREQWDTH